MSYILINYQFFVDGAEVANTGVPEREGSVAKKALKRF